MNNLGGSVISNNIIENKGRLKWCVRENFVNEVDNGWRFFSEIDTEEYLSNPRNLSIYSWEHIFKIEPAIGIIFNLPIGTELTLVYEDEKKYFIYTNTGERLV